MANRPPIPWHDMCNSFVPIEAPNAQSSQNTKALIDQVVIKDGSLEAFAYISLKQYRHDAAQKPQRQTWAIVNTNLEAYLFRRDLEEGHIRDASTLPPGSVVTLEADISAARPGKLCVLTYGTFKKLLVRQTQIKAFLPDDMTLMLNFGCGYITFNMALCSTLAVNVMARRAWTTAQKNTLAMCIVASIESSPLGREWPIRGLYEVAQFANPNVSSWSRYQWHRGDVSQQDIFQALATTLMAIDGRADGQGTIVSMPIHDTQANLPWDRLIHKVFKHYDGQNPEDVYDQKYMANSRHLFVDPGQMTFYGLVKNIGHVLVCPYKMDWVRDRRTGQPVLHDAVPLTQSEILSANRFRNENGQDVPKVHCFMQFQTLTRLPPEPQTCPAHTIGLGKLLLMSIQAWEQENLSVMELPISLPADEFAVENELRFLRVKGLINQVSPPKKPWISTGRELAYGIVNLTPLGINTVRVLQETDLESLNAAIFLAAILPAPTATQQPASLSVVQEVALRIASVIETRDGITELVRIVQTPKATTAHLANLNHLQLKSFAAAHLRRGPIWLAMALWHRMIGDMNLRNHKSSYSLGETSELVSFHYVPDVLIVRSLLSYAWDEQFARLAQAFGATRELQEGFIQPLSTSQLCEVETALTQAHLDKLALVPVVQRPSKRQPTLPFAFDLHSGKPLLEPHAWQQCQLDTEYCRQLKDGPDAEYIFCIYSRLEDGRQFGRPGLIPIDLTFVSSRCVSQILKAAPGDYKWQTMLGKIQSHMDLKWPPSSGPMLLSKPNPIGAAARSSAQKPLHDARIITRGDRRHLGHELSRNWPSIPGRYRDSHEASALDSVVILLRVAFAMFDELHPKEDIAEDEGDFSRYAWASYDHSHGQYQIMERARQLALQDIKKNLGPNTDITFANLCKSPSMVAALWAHVDFQATRPWIMTSPQYPNGTVVKSSAEIAKGPAPLWTGDDEIQDFVEAITHSKRVPGQTEARKWVLFNSPRLLHIDLLPSDTAKVSLQKAWRFWSDIWRPIPTDDPRIVKVDKRGKIGYVLTAIVRHAKRDGNPDQIRLFRPNGMELLPKNLADSEPMPDWGFKMNEPVPKGEKLSLFYKVYAQLDVMKVRERQRENSIGEDLAREIDSLLLSV